MNTTSPLLQARALLETTINKITAANPDLYEAMDEPIRLAILNTLAFKSLGAIRTNVGLAQLVAMWDNYTLFQFAGEYNDFMEYVDGELLADENADREDVLTWANAVSVTLAWLYAHDVRDNDGERITVERLLDRKGVLNRIKNSVAMMRKAKANGDDEQAERIIKEIWAGSQRSIRVLRETLTNEDISETAVGTITVRKRLNPTGTADYILSGLTAQQSLLVEMLLGETVTYEFDTE